MVNMRLVAPTSILFSCECTFSLTQEDINAILLMHDNTGRVEAIRLTRRLFPAIGLADAREVVYMLVDRRAVNNLIAKTD